MCVYVCLHGLCVHVCVCLHGLCVNVCVCVCVCCAELGLGGKGDSECVPAYTDLIPCGTVHRPDCRRLAGVCKHGHTHTRTRTLCTHACTHTRPCICARTYTRVQHMLALRRTACTHMLQLLVGSGLHACRASLGWVRFDFCVSHPCLHAPLLRW